MHAVLSLWVGSNKKEKKGAWQEGFKEGDGEVLPSWWLLNIVERYFVTVLEKLLYDVLSGL